ncbi:MAG: biotin--[acetyl-CoA-carboxylase] ligase [bacterium]|nr:biotin--[acetyl-CoA-carboxylase] ligase [bacterium]
MHKFFAKPLFLGKNVIFLPECHSTNDYALNALNKPDIREGTVIITDNQTKGRGQRGNIWVSEPGKNIILSLVLEPGFLQISQQFGLTLVTSLAVYDLLSQYVPQVRIKWPNDIYIGEKKTAGILIENSLRNNKIEHAVIGIGININQQGFLSNLATSLSLEKGEVLEREALIEELLVFIEKWYLKLKKGQTELRDEYLSRLYWFKENRVFEDAAGEFEGSILGVDPLGRLVVKTTSGQRVFDIKEVKFIK